MEQNTSKLISIWVWVGLILMSYGIIISLCGIYYIFSPQSGTALAQLNPSLWWGCVMLFSGLLFIIAGIITNRRG